MHQREKCTSTETRRTTAEAAVFASVYLEPTNIPVCGVREHELFDAPFSWLGLHIFFESKPPLAFYHCLVVSFMAMFYCTLLLFRWKYRHSWSNRATDITLRRSGVISGWEVDQYILSLGIYIITLPLVPPTYALISLTSTSCHGEGK